MRTQNKEEYTQTRAEIIRTQDCITDYLKAFFAVGASIVSVVLVISRLGIAVPSVANFIYPSFGFVIIALELIVIAFAAIMSHKFITHNRYAGYAQAMSFENKHADDVARLPNDCFFWEFCLFIIHNEDAAESGTSTPTEKAVVEYLRRCDEACKFWEPAWHGVPHYRDMWRFFKRSAIGAYMLFRAPFNKLSTKSWTYPYFVTFGAFVIFISLLLALFSVITVSVSGSPQILEEGHIIPIDYQIIIQSMFAVYLLMCCGGIFNRLYRVCADDGDRTVQYFFYRFTLARQKALRRYNIPYDWAAIPSPR